MKFKPYPSYKDSGVEWLGEVPEHWTVNPLKYVVSMPITDGPHETPDFIDDGIPFVSAEAVSSGEIDFNKIRGFISKRDHLKFSKKYCPKRGDIFVIKSGATTGVSAIVRTDIEFNIWSPLAVIRCSDSFNNTFILNSLRSSNFQDAMALNWSFGTQQNIGMGVMGNLRITIPIIREQTKIANFLDRETHRIDMLIEEKNRFIDLLKEKRLALISHAVTKGLDPTVKMKDSGVEWLGEVPEHWDIKRLKLLMSDIKAGPFGSAITKDMYVNFGYRVYGQEQVIPNNFSIGDYYIDENKYNELKQYQVSPGDVLISCVGTFGKIAIIPPGIEPGVINPRLIRLRCLAVITSEYLVSILRSSVVFEQFILLSRGGTMDVINIGILNEIVLPVPDILEQKEILLFINAETTKIDTLIQETQTSIELLKEHRTALISAAVTGKIDVREFAN